MIMAGRLARFRNAVSDKNSITPDDGDSSKNAQLLLSHNFL